MRRLLPMLALVAASVGAAGCNEYHYYDIDVTFNTAAGQFAGINEVSTIQVLVMSVTGADSDVLQIGPNSGGLPLQTGAHLGIFEFSTFADSGQLNFKIDAYDDDSSANPGCKTGEGTKTINASATITVMETMTINKISPGCVPDGTL